MHPEREHERGPERLHEPHHSSARDLRHVEVKVERHRHLVQKVYVEAKCAEPPCCWQA
ncbi:MAG: hypothetical protein KatS3mg082_2993 [Nitrospiraceae bacterium]|nr:MAG: hypothetical protein KatS3mg082_2993 [Nitrospiraceae bacterium]